MDRLPRSRYPREKPWEDIRDDHAIPRGGRRHRRHIGFTAPDVLHAQSYPARSVTLIVPSAAGGGTDTIARLIGDQLSKQLGQGFVVENRTGAGMLVGTTAVAKAAPDGYTLLVGLNGNMSVNPSLFAKLPYDPLARLHAGRDARQLSVPGAS